MNELPVYVEESLCRYIAQRMGICIQDHQLTTLRQTVIEACNHFGLKSPHEYLDILTANNDSLSPELEFLAVKITVGESYFFRDKDQTSFLQESCLPKIIEQKRRDGNLSLRIWSAGCSRGQEIYTIAILLDQLLPDLERWKLHLLGTDINPQVLSEAIKGRFNDWSLRAISATHKTNYFQPGKADYQLVSKIRHMVKFSYLNLIDDSFPSILGETNNLDMIICRNVFIYLHKHSIHAVMKKFEVCLNPHGVILTGVSDLVDRELFGLVGEGAGANFHYRVKNDSATASTDDTVHREIHDHGNNRNPRSESQYGYEKPVETGVEKNVTHQKIDAQSLSHKQIANSPATTHEDIINLLRSQSWTLARQATDTVIDRDGESDLLLQFKATALANLGQLEEAVECCHRCLELNAFNKRALLDLGLVLSELCKEKEAEAAIERAIYIDRHYLEAHYHLGLLRFRNGQIKLGLKSISNALKIAKKGDPNWEIQHSAGMSYHRFIQIMEKEITMYTAIQRKKGQAN